MCGCERERERERFRQTREWSYSIVMINNRSKLAPAEHNIWQQVQLEPRE